MIRHFFGRLRPAPRGRHARPEGVHPVTVAWYYADPDPAAPTVRLPTVLYQDPRHDATVVLHTSAFGQPTTRDCPPATDDGKVDHVGADESEFPALLAEMRYDLAHDSGGIDPDSLAWEQELAELDKRLAAHRLTFARRWRDIVAPLADRIAPGWQHEPPIAVADFAEARKLATGEIPAVVA